MTASCSLTILSTMLAPAQAPANVDEFVREYPRHADRISQVYRRMKAHWTRSNAASYSDIVGVHCLGWDDRRRVTFDESPMTSIVDPSIKRLKAAFCKDGKEADVLVTGDSGRPFVVPRNARHSAVHTYALCEPGFFPYDANVGRSLSSTETLADEYARRKGDLRLHIEAGGAEFTIAYDENAIRPSPWRREVRFRASAPWAPVQSDWGPINLDLGNPTHSSSRIVVKYDGEHRGTPLVKVVRMFQRPAKQKEYLAFCTSVVTMILPLESPPALGEFEVSAVGATPFADPTAPTRSYWWIWTLAVGIIFVAAAYIRHRRLNR